MLAIASTQLCVHACHAFQEIRFERRLLKERVVEDELYEGKEKFVTGAYRRKLEEDKKWQEQQKIKWVRAVWGQGGGTSSRK